MSKKSRKKQSNDNIGEHIQPTTSTKSQGAIATTRPDPQGQGDKMPIARLNRDQQRATYAYKRVNGLPLGDRKEYKTTVRALGPNILRSGLSAAFADLMRRGKGAKALREHLAAAGIPGLNGVAEDKIFENVNQLPAEQYMLATRETLQVVLWHKRAAEALIKDAAPPQGGSDAR